MLKVFTYNVNNNNQALYLCLSHVKRMGLDCVICIQEAPLPAKIGKRTKNLIANSFNTDSFPSRIQLFTTRNVKIERIDKMNNPRSERYEVAKITVNGYVINIVNLHNYDLLNNQYGSPDRQKTYELFKSIRELYASKTIFAGDFNSDPYTEEMGSIYGMFSRYENDDVSVGCPRNDAWEKLSERSIGSYRLGGANKVRSWRMLDQIVYTCDLILNNIEIHKELNNVPLLNGNSYPKDTISDHLPVSMDCIGVKP